MTTNRSFNPKKKKHCKYLEKSEPFRAIFLFRPADKR